jgi:hypothetical protein
MKAVRINRQPGPTIVDHHPGLPVIGCVPAAHWSPVSAWHSRTALDLSGVEPAECFPGQRQRRDAPAGIQRQELRHRKRMGLTRSFACDI